MNQRRVGPAEVGSHKPVGGIVRHQMDTAGNQRFSGPSEEGRGNGGCMAGALILMSDWCGFARRQIIENPDADKLGTEFE